MFKTAYAYPKIADAFRRGGITEFCVGSVAAGDILRSQSHRVPRLMGHAPRTRLVDVARDYDFSLHSEPETLRLLGEELAGAGKVQQFYVAIDVGDLRDGIRLSEVHGLVSEIDRHHNEHLEFAGIAATVGCCRQQTMAPSVLGSLLSYRSRMRKQGRHIRVSVGGSAVLPLLMSAAIGAQPDELRVGESVLVGTVPHSPELGREIGLVRPLRLVGEIVEMKDKWDSSLGQMRRRGIVDFGSLHCEPTAVWPTLPGVF